MRIYFPDLIDFISCFPSLLRFLIFTPYLLISYLKAYLYFGSSIFTVLIVCVCVGIWNNIFVRRCTFNKNQYTAARALQYGKFIDKTSHWYAGITEEAFIRSNTAARHTCSSSNSLSTKLARGITRCRISCLSWSVSIFYLTISTIQSGTESERESEREEK